MGCNPDDPEPTPTNYIIQGPQDLFPAFSPDGEQIAYFHEAWDSPDPPEGYPSGLYIIDKDGGSRSLVLEAGYINSPSWSPDGEWLVFSNSGVIQKCKRDGSELTTFDGLDDVEGGFFFPDWTPDGEYILFDRAINEEGVSNLFSMTADFAEAQPIFGITLIASRNVELSPTHPKIVYMKASAEWPHWEIFLANVQGTSNQRLTQGKDNRDPSWSPDGNQIAWSRDGQLSLMNADGSNQRRIAFGNNPSWSVNSDIVYSHANADYTKEVLYTISSDGKNQTQITF